jgi:hypothetical protein
MNFRHLIYTIFFLIFFITFPNQQINACAYIPEPNRTSITFFHPDLFTDSTYRACYLDAPYYMPDEYASPEVRNRVNLLEWQRYFNGEPDLKALAEVIYELDVSTLEKQVLPVFLKNLPPNGTVSKDRFLSLLYKRKDTESIQYLLFAKHCEPHVQNNWGYWSEPERDTKLMENLIAEGLQHYEASKSSYLKLRYAFQIVRLSHYTGNYKQCIDLYDRLVTPLLSSESDTLVTKSIVAGWLLALKAGALLHIGQAAEAMYQFSVVFDRFPYSRELAIRNFTYGNEDVWQQMLEMGKTPDEKATLWLLRALQNTALDLDPLKQICSFAPASELAEIELIRQVNIIERFWLTPKLTQPIPLERQPIEMESTNSKTGNSFWDKVKSFFRKIYQSIKKIFKSSEETDSTFIFDQSQYLTELKKFALAHAESHQTANTDLWFTVAAYMAYLEQNYKQSYQLLGKVTGANKKVQQQANLIYALNRLEESRHLDAELENLFAYALQNLPQPEFEYDNYSVFSRVLTKLAVVYLQNGNVARAALCLEKAKETSSANAILDFYTSEQDMDTLLKLAVRPQKSVFESFLLNNSRFTAPFLQDVKGTKLMRQLRFDEALLLYEEIPVNYWQQQYNEESFFYENYWFFDCNFDDENKEVSEVKNDTCNKMEFASHVIQLEKMAKQDPQTADKYYFQIAVGFFSTPFWGYNGAIWEGSLVSTLNYYFDYAPGEYPLNIPEIAEKVNDSEKRFVAEYGTREVAIRYFQKAIDATKNPELAVQAAYLAALSKQEPLSTLHEGDYRDKTYLKLMSSQYKNTDFFRTISQTCPGIGDF